MTDHKPSLNDWLSVSANNEPSLGLMVDWLQDAVDDGDWTRAEVLASELCSAARRFVASAKSKDDDN